MQDSPDVFDDVETEEEEYNHEEDEQEDGDEDVGEDDEYSSDASDSENGERPWKKLRFEVIDDLSSNYDEQVERLQQKVCSGCKTVLPVSFSSVTLLEILLMF